jgi:two-component system response regulator YesN
MIKVIIVDDDYYEREGIKKTIDWEKMNATVVGTFKNGKEAVDFVSSNDCDLIISDIQMPVMDGVVLSEEINRLQLDIGIIFITSYDYFEYAKAAIENKVLSFILKPYYIDDVQKEIETIVKQIRENKNQREIAKITKHKLEQYLPVLREELILDLINGRMIDNDKIGKRLDFLDLAWGIDKSYICISIKTVFVGKSEADEEIIKQSLREFLEKEVRDVFGTDALSAFTSTEGIYTILIAVKSNQNLEEIIKVIEEIRENVFGNIGLETIIGVSNLYNNLSDTKTAFRETKDAIAHEIYVGNEHIIFYKDIDNSSKKPIDSVNIFTEILLNDIRLGFADKITQDINDIFEKMTMYIHDNDYIQNICIDIINEIQRIMWQNNIEQKSFFGEDINPIAKLLRFETILDIKQWMQNISLLIAEAILELKTDNNKKIVTKIKTFIENNFGRDLPVSEILEGIDVSNGYASTIFKKETGFSIVDYIIFRRIEEAKNLLSNSYMKISEISEKVGFRSLSYFGLTFKNYEAISPSEYRNKYFSDKKALEGEGKNG